MIDFFVFIGNKMIPGTLLSFHVVQWAMIKIIDLSTFGQY